MLKADEFSRLWRLIYFPRGTYLVPAHAETSSVNLLCLQLADCSDVLVGAPGLEPGTR
jgi:hypothetical protein